MTCTCSLGNIGSPRGQLCFDMLWTAAACRDMVQCSGMGSPPKHVQLTAVGPLSKPDHVTWHTCYPNRGAEVPGPPCRPPAPVNKP